MDRRFLLHVLDGFYNDRGTDYEDALINVLKYHFHFVPSAMLMITDNVEDSLVLERLIEQLNKRKGLKEDEMAIKALIGIITSKWE